MACSTDSPSDAWAVGYSSVSGFQPLIEHWNGSAWSLVEGAAAYPAGRFNRLPAVGALSSSDVWALGVTGG